MNDLTPEEAEGIETFCHDMMFRIVDLDDEDVLPLRAMFAEGEEEEGAFDELPEEATVGQLRIWLRTALGRLAAA